MLIVECKSFPIEQIGDLEALEWRLADWVAAQGYPMRLLAFSRCFDMRPLIERAQADLRALQPLAEVADPILEAVRALIEQQPGALHPAEVISLLSQANRALLSSLLAGTPIFQAVLDLPWEVEDATWEALAEALASGLWAVPWLKEMVRFYTTLGEKHLRSASYYLLTWEPSKVAQDAIVDSLKQATRRDVEVVDRLPPVLAGNYSVDEQRARLVPQTPGQPYLAILRSYDMGGEWTAETLHRLLSLDFDVALAIDTLTFEPAQAARAIELAQRTAVGVLRGGAQDPRAERLIPEAQQGLHRLDREQLHDVQIAVLVSGETANELAKHVATVRDMLGSTLRLDAVAGGQRELLKLWSTLPAERIDAPWRRYNMFSQGVGCCFGVLGYHRAGATEGPLWGVDATRRAPLFYDPFVDRNAAHTVVIGSTGSGKTFFLNTLTLRAAAVNGYKVIWVDAFENVPRLAAAAGAGVQTNWFDFGSGINILDIVFDQATDGGWVNAQTQYVISQLALLLGTPGTTPQGKRCYVPQQFTAGERGILDAALNDLYAGLDPDAPLHEMPLLDDLIAALDDLDEPEATAIADELCKLIHGSRKRDEGRLTTLGRCFNSMTSVDWDFSADISCLDLSEIARAAPELLPFYYAQIVAAVNRYMRDPARDRSRPTFLIVDEWGYAAQVDAVEQLGATICSVARKYGIGFIPADQMPETFMRTEAGRRILEQSPGKVVFHLARDSADQIVQSLGLPPDYADYLFHAGRGQALAVFHGDAYPLMVEPAAGERKVLSNS